MYTTISAAGVADVLRGYFCLSVFAVSVFAVSVFAVSVFALQSRLAMKPAILFRSALMLSAPIVMGVAIVATTPSWANNQANRSNNQADRQTSNLPVGDQAAGDDAPEEVLRTEIVTGARSPIDNRPMTATEYTQLQNEIKTLNQTPGTLSPKVRNTVALLKLRKFIKTVLPFVPIK
jgi:hypothetical protein